MNFRDVANGMQLMQSRCEKKRDRVIEKYLGGDYYAPNWHRFGYMSTNIDGRKSTAYVYMLLIRTAWSLLIGLICMRATGEIKLGEESTCPRL